MTRTGMSQSAIFAWAALAAATCGGAAFGQDGEDSAETAAPQHLEACGAERCLEARLSPALQQKLAGGESVTLEELAEGLVFDYQGQEPLRAHFVAARYDDDRLVRYDISTAALLEPGAATIPDANVVVLDAFRPKTEETVSAAQIEAEISSPTADMPETGFVGEMPANTLMGLIKPDLEAPLSLDERDALNSVGVMAVIPADRDLRGETQSASVGTVIRLDYKE